MKKLIFIILAVLLSLNLFASEKKDVKKEKSAVMCIVIYSDRQPAIVNISFGEDKDKNYIKTKTELFRKNYKANEIKSLTEGEETEEISFAVKGAAYIPGTGDALKPFISTFYDEKQIIVYFMGDYTPCDYPLTFYEKEDFYLLMKLHDDAMEYRICPGGKTVKLPADRKTLEAYTFIKKTGIYICYGAGAALILIFIGILLKRAVKRSKKTKRNMYD